MNIYNANLVKYTIPTNNIIKVSLTSKQTSTHPIQPIQPIQPSLATQETLTKSNKVNMYKLFVPRLGSKSDNMCYGIYQNSKELNSEKANLEIRYMQNYYNIKNSIDQMQTITKIYKEKGYNNNEPQPSFKTNNDLLKWSVIRTNNNGCKEKFIFEKID